MMMMMKVILLYFIVLAELTKSLRIVVAKASDSALDVIIIMTLTATTARVYEMAAANTADRLASSAISYTIHTSLEVC